MHPAQELLSWGVARYNPCCPTTTFPEFTTTFNPDVYSKSAQFIPNIQIVFISLVLISLVSISLNKIAVAINNFHLPFTPLLKHPCWPLAVSLAPSIISDPPLLPADQNLLSSLGSRDNILPNCPLDTAHHVAWESIAPTTILSHAHGSLMLLLCPVQVQCQTIEKLYRTATTGVLVSRPSHHLITWLTCFLGKHRSQH